MSVHDGHRERLRARAMKDNDLDTFPDHNVLELLLFSVIPRGDVNPLAHRIIERFGSLAAALEASPEELMNVEGVGEKTAAFLTLIPKVARRYLISKSGESVVVRSPDDAGRYLLPRFFGERNETVYALLLDAKGAVIDCRRMGRGGLNAAAVDVRDVAEYAISQKAAGVILAHNHTSGIAIPSHEDEEATEKLNRALDVFGIRLIDHLVVADNDFVSMADNGFFNGR